jgi:hypothetical protein
MKGRDPGTGEMRQDFTKIKQPVVGLGQAARRAASRLVPYNNKRTTSPPGMIGPGPGTPIIIASLMRSGTHLLIDLILNNFRSYKKSPLYIELDNYFYQGFPGRVLLSCGSRVMKTHFPQLKHSPEDQEQIPLLARRAFVISPERDLEDAYRSTAAFGYRIDRRSFMSRCQEFDSFWNSFPRLVIPFDDLTRAAAVRDTLEEIEEFIKVKRNDRTIMPPARSSTAYVRWLKLLTRALGRKASVINTTIQFNPLAGFHGR